jgi:hypothetical protein
VEKGEDIDSKEVVDLPRIRSLYLIIENKSVCIEVYSEGG